MLMLTPGATSFGYTVPSQADWPRLLKLAMASAASIAPAEKPCGLLAGLTLVSGAGPSLPAANATAMPAFLSTSMSALNSVMHCPAVPTRPHEAFTTSGASTVFKSPSGSSSH